ncbi:MAG: FAD-binding oxidoreductase, partial [Planctomycetaceae bacterium]|nr:FAD-binding oxidoreductase [Planctomycetaceae bacterium]
MPLTPSSSDAELKPLSVGEVSRTIQSRFSDGGRPLQIVGGRTSLTQLALDRTPSETLTTTGLTRVIDYPARDMTITVEAGLRVEELQNLLAEQGQTLPIDIPAARRATIGGAVAANVSGPGRYGYGAFRDYLIGVRAVDGRGRLFAAGGRVVKNVAGYDLCKLLVGSEGRLAVIAEVTLKVRPLPEARTLVWLTMGDWDATEHALDGLTRTQTRPVAIEVVNARAARQLVQ